MLVNTPIFEDLGKSRSTGSNQLAGAPPSPVLVVDVKPYSSKEGDKLITFIEDFRLAQIPFYPE